MSDTVTYNEVLRYLTDGRADYYAPGPHTLDCRYSKSTHHRQWNDSAEFEAISRSQVGADLDALYQKDGLTLEERQSGLQLATTQYIMKSGGSFELVVDRTAMSREAMEVYLRFIVSNAAIDIVNGIPREDIEKLYRQRTTVDPTQKDLIEDRIAESLRVGRIVEVAPPRAKPPSEDILERVARNIELNFGPEIEAIVRAKEALFYKAAEVPRASEEAGRERRFQRSTEELLPKEQQELSRYRELGAELQKIQELEKHLTTRALSKESIEKLIKSLGQHGDYIRSVFDSETEAVVRNRIKDTLAKLQGDSTYRKERHKLDSPRLRL